MRPRDIILLALEAWDGHIDGKTKLQKIVYFIGVLTGQEDELGYDAHYYGPYSAVVDQALYDLTAVGLVDRRAHRTGQAGGTGFEKVRYEYSLTEGGKEIAAARKAQLGDAGSRVAQAAAELKAKGDRHYMRLAAAAKVKYIVSHSGKPVTREKLQELAEGLGWNLEPDAVGDAVDYLIELRLVKVTSQ